MKVISGCIYSDIPAGFVMLDPIESKIRSMCVTK